MALPNLHVLHTSIASHLALTSFDNIQYRKTAFDKYIQSVVWISSKQMKKASSIQYLSYKENFENKALIQILIKAVTYLDELHKRSQYEFIHYYL